MHFRRNKSTLNAALEKYEAGKHLQPSGWRSLSLYLLTQQQKAKNAAKELAFFCLKQETDAKMSIDIGERDIALKCLQRSIAATSLCFEEFIQSKAGWIDKYIIKSAQYTQKTITAVINIADLLNVNWETPHLFLEIDEWKERV